MNEARLKELVDDLAKDCNRFDRAQIEMDIRYAIEACARAKELQASLSAIKARN
jgi:hypothetical protein